MAQQHRLFELARRALMVERATRCASLAWRDLGKALGKQERRRLGLHHIELPHGELFAAAAVPHIWFNRTWLRSAGSLNAAARCYGQLGVQNFLLSFPPSEALRAELVGAPLGLRRFHRDWEVLARGPGGPMPQLEVPKDVAIRDAERRDAPQVARLLCDAFDVPASGAPFFEAAVGRSRWTVLVAESRQTIVAAGLSYASREACYLMAGATAPPFRRRGIQRALVAARVARALEQGALVVASETGVAVPGQPNHSWNNLRRAGLEPVSRSAHVCPPHTGWTPPRLRAASGCHDVTRIVTPPPRGPSARLAQD